jgi:hypothetical protein
MKNNLLLIIIHSLITASSCIAMENLDIQKYIRFEKPKILSEITIIKQPLQAEYLDEDRILVNGKDGCCIIDPRTNQEIKRIDVQAPHFTIHPTTKKIAFAGEKPAIYSSTGDLETPINIKTTETYPISKCAFNPSCNEVLLGCDSSYGESYDCTTGHRTDKLPYPFAHISCNHTLAHHIKLDITKCTESIMHPITNNPTYIEIYNNWVYMKFHPNSAVLATVLLLWINHKPHQTVFYRDVITLKILATTSPFPTIEKRNIYENIAFSPDGRKIIIVSPDKCTILPVPFEVLYNTTEELFYLYWFLSKECLAQHDIPDDVQKIVAFNVLEKFKR